MELQKTVIPNSCVPTAFAMAIDMPIVQMLAEIGHQGDAIVWPGLPDPTCRRGFHVQECIDICVAHGKWPVHIETCPASSPYSRLPNANEMYAIPMDYQRRVEKYLTDNICVIFGQKHAVAWNGMNVYDPQGKKYPLSKLDFNISDIYVFTPILI